MTMLTVQTRSKVKESKALEQVMEKLVQATTIDLIVGIHTEGTRILRQIRKHQPDNIYITYEQIYASAFHVALEGLVKPKVLPEASYYAYEGNIEEEV